MVRLREFLIIWIVIINLLLILILLILLAVTIDFLVIAAMGFLTISGTSVGKMPGMTMDRLVEACGGFKVLLQKAAITSIGGNLQGFFKIPAAMVSVRFELDSFLL